MFGSGYNYFKDWDKKQQYVPNYGPANAVADIMGAIFERNKQRADNKNLIKTNELLSQMNFDPNQQEQSPGLFSQNLSAQQPINTAGQPDTTGQQPGVLPQSLSVSQPLLTEGLFGSGVTLDMNPVYNQGNNQVDSGQQNQPPTGAIVADNMPAIGKTLSEQTMPFEKSATSQLPAAQNQSVIQAEISPAPPNKQSIMRQKYAYKAKLLKELHTNGIRDFKAVMPQVDALVDDWANNQMSQQTQQFIDGKLNEFAEKPNMDDKRAYMWALSAKNRGLNIDPGEFAKMYAAKKMEALDIGDRIEMVDPYKEGSFKKGVDPTVVYNKENVSADTVYRVNNTPRGSGGSGTTKLGKSEQWALQYESGSGLANDTALINSLSTLDPEKMTASQKVELDQAKARRDQYWVISSGGAYGAPTPPQPQPQSASNDMAAAYQQEWQRVVDSGLTPEQAYQYMTEKYGG